LRHATVAAVTDDVANLRFNTAISRMMEFVNVMTGQTVRPRSVMEDFIKLLSPFAPHIGEEIWHRLGHEESVAYVAWPTFDPGRLVKDTVTLPVSVNGKLRSRLEVSTEAPEDAVLALALADPGVSKHLEGKPPRKVIYRPGKMLNLVV
jgi:leucyl-tRNA synthetase